MAVAAITVAAYHYSLLTLLRGLTLDTPLAYLALVPVIVVLLIAIRALTPHREPDIHDRYLDYMIGLPLLAGALILLIVLPIRMSTFYWYWRIDLLSLPLFLAGAVSLVFGLRALWRVRLAIAFLFLAWPVPYLLVLTGELNAVTAITLAMLRLVLRFVPLAQPLPSTDQALFVIAHAGNQFTLSVGSACSGVNGMVGFGLVGLAFASLVRGRLSAKLLWLAAGLALIWLLDLARVLAIFAAGSVWGERFALNVLHPVVGLAFFNAGVLVMVAALPLFGLGLRFPPLRLSSGRGTAPRVARRPPAVKRAKVAVAILAAMAAVAATADAQMQHYELVAQDFGPPRLIALSVATAEVPGWAQHETATYPWVTRYFGSGASWERFVFSPPDPSVDAAGASVVLSPVTLDVISTTDLHSFSAYGVEACYRFHDYRIVDTRRADLGGGIVGHTIVATTSPNETEWTAVYWEWPVDTGSGVRYERVILNVTGPSHQGQLSTFLAGFARSIVAGTAAKSLVGSATG
jgi:exosortase/archaeosortase family protein